ncbi:PIN domain-like protein, partial [Mycena capillaripes]
QFFVSPLTVVFIFDGPGRPPIKCGTRVIHRPPWLIQYLKTMITAFGFYFYDVSNGLLTGLAYSNKRQAPGEAEAELAQLNKNGEIDGIITEDSNTFLFGAQCVIRTQGSVQRPSVQHSSLTFTSESIENTDAVSLDQDGLFFCALLLGGDYDSGIAGAGITVAHALAAEGFGKDLVAILKSFRGAELSRRLTVWRNRLQQELRTNSLLKFGIYAWRYRKLADSIPDTFPDVQVAKLYLNPLTSRSPEFTGPKPVAQLWRLEGCRIVEAVNTREVGQTELRGAKNDRTIVWSFKSSH